MTYISSIILLIFIAYQVYAILKANKENGLFYYTVFQMYLKKRGLSNEKIDEETDEWARCHNELSEAIGFKAIGEDKYREKIVEFRKKNGLDN